jgi:hypothetical protein
MKIETGHLLKFQIGQKVYLKTDKNQEERIVIKIQLMPNEGVLYFVSCSCSSEWYYDIELTRERDDLKAIL